MITRFFEGKICSLVHPRTLAILRVILPVFIVLAASLLKVSPTHADPGWGGVGG